MSKLQESKRAGYERLRGQLDQERSTFVSHWRDLSDYIAPRRTRFFVQDANRGDRRNNRIIDSTATLAARTLRSGMVGGITSPARPWFRLSTPDPRLAEAQQNKVWLENTARDMTTKFLKSNLYNALPILYLDMAVFGTGAIFVEEDFEEVFRFYPLPIGSYFIANDARLRVNVFMRDFRMTVRQLIEKFGQLDEKNEVTNWENFSTMVKGLYDNNNLEAWVDVAHVVKPNPAWDKSKMQSKHKKYISCYYERGSSSASTANHMTGSDDDKYLRESGYDYFPVLVGRWEITGEDVYGTSCPGMDSLGDSKQLQTGEKRAAQAIEKQINPPMNADISMKNSKASILPGDINYVVSREGRSGFTAAHEVRTNIADLEAKQEQVRARISRAFYEDLFLMLSQSDRREITAREIDERHEEKLLALGPVLEQLNQDILDPLIDIAFEFMLRQGLIAPPPPDLHGATLKVEYISVMAQAQKLYGIAGVERFAGFVGRTAEITQDPSVLDKVNIDQMIDVYGDLTGVSPSIINSDEIVAAKRQQRAKAQEAAQEEQMANAAAKASVAAKNLSETDVKGDNALTRLSKMASAGQLAQQ